MSAPTHSEERAKDWRDEPCSPFVVRCCECIEAHGVNGMLSLAEMAARLNTSRLACHSAMRSLESKGLSGYIRSSKDQWGVQLWFLEGNAQSLPPADTAQKR